MVVAVYIHVTLRFNPGQRCVHSLLQQLNACAAQLLRRSHHAAPALRGEHITQPVVHQEFSLQQTGLRCGNPHVHRVDRHLPASVRSAATTSTWTRPNTLGVRRCRHSNPRSRCMTTGNSSMLTLSHSVSLPKRAKSARQLVSRQSLSAAGSATETSNTGWAAGSDPWALPPKLGIGMGLLAIWNAQKAQNELPKWAIFHGFDAYLGLNKHGILKIRN